MLGQQPKTVEVQPLLRLIMRMCPLECGKVVNAQELDHHMLQECANRVQKSPKTLEEHVSRDFNQKCATCQALLEMKREPGKFSNHECVSYII